MSAGQATLGTFFCFAAAILLIFVSVSSPTWERVSFLDVISGSETTHFGVFGHTGTSPSVGYTFDTDYFKFDSTLSQQVILNLTKMLILHPIAAGLCVIAFLCGLCGMGYHRSGTVFMTLLSSLAGIITLVAWIIDMTLFSIARNRFRYQGFQADYGNANWLTFGALLALILGFIFATVGMSARDAETERLATVWRNAPLHLTSLQPDLPRLNRGLLWTLDESGHSPTALSTLYDNPLPRPPPQEYRKEIFSTISNHPNLFRIITPVNITSFQCLLLTHPNRPFVDSVLVGLREGFWPFANTHPDTYPLTYDASPRPPKTAAQRQFLVDQCNTEIACDRFSAPFGTELLPGMYSMPIHSVPKPGSSKLRLVVDHSASDYSLNSMISRDDIAGARLDSIKDLADSLIQFRREHGSVKLVLFKSDVSAAYRRLPMHPLWQVKQIVTVEGLRHVDRCNSFGNRASQRLWVSFMALVTWIAMFVKNLEHLKLYTDDCFSFECATDFALYKPYNLSLPVKQVRLLETWDEIGVPHDVNKQVWGDTLVIIGFLVDPNAMTVTMPPAKLEDLLLAIHSFCFPSNKSRKQTVRRFMQMAGWMNWALNVFPLLKPGLRALHEKIGTKEKPDDLISINTNIRFELSWFANHARRLSGVHIMESIAWQPSEANYVFFCDASLSGLGCYFPAGSRGFQAVPPSSAPKKNIFFLEALCVCWAIHIAHRLSLHGRLLFFTNNENTVTMFNRLYTPLAVFNPILLSAVDILTTKPFSIQVMSIPGSDNHIADSLSRRRNTKLRSQFPDVTIDTTEPLPVLPSPPRDSLGWLS